MEAKVAEQVAAVLDAAEAAGDGDLLLCLFLSLPTILVVSASVLINTKASIQIPGRVMTMSGTSPGLVMLLALIGHLT